MANALARALWILEDAKDRSLNCLHRLPHHEIGVSLADDGRLPIIPTKYPTPRFLLQVFGLAAALHARSASARLTTLQRENEERTSQEPRHWPNLSKHDQLSYIC